MAIKSPFDVYKELIDQKFDDIEEAKKLINQKLSNDLYISKRIDTIETKAGYEKRLLDGIEYDNKADQGLIKLNMGTAAITKASIGSIVNQLKVSGETDSLLVSAVDNSLFTCDTCLINSYEIAKNYALEGPEKQKVLKEVDKLDLITHNELFELLMEKLKGFDDDLIDMLKSSEEVLNIELINSGTLATHPMRDLFQAFLERNSPDEIVKKQAWFEETKYAKGNVSRRSRLRYYIYGSNEDIDNNVLESLDQAANEAKTILDLGHNYAHKHDNSIDLAQYRNVIDKLRRTLIEIIKLHDKYFVN